MSGTSVEHVDVLVTRTALQKVFFNMFAFDSPEELLAAVDRMDVDVDTLARCRDIRYVLADGWLYWFFFTKGYLQYRRAGRVENGNAYYDYLVKHFIAQGHNPAMREQLEDREFAAERVARRYRDFDLLAAKAGAEVVPDVNPIRVTVSDPPSPHPYLFYARDRDSPVVVRAIDGWHRMCSARLCGIQILRCDVFDEDLGNKAIRGVIDTFACRDGRLVVSGWWLNPEQPIYNYELRRGGKTIATGIPVKRPDIKSANPGIVHAERAGFAIDCAWKFPPEDATDLLMVGLQDIIPVGVLRVPSAADQLVEGRGNAVPVAIEMDNR
jgi:hypothetical protein